MKVFLTGGSGFIGSHLREALMEEPSIKGFTNYDLQDGHDILDIDKLTERTEGYDIIVHLAAKVDIPESVKRPAYYYLHNIEGTANVIRAAKKNKIEGIVFASSSTVYYPYNSPYALSKMVNEVMLERSDIPTVSLRFFNVYGRDGRTPCVIPQFISRIKKGKDFIIYGDGEQTRDFVHVDDICEAIIDSAKRDYIPNTYDIGTKKTISINDLAKLVMKLANKKVNIIYKKERQEIKHSSTQQNVIIGKTKLVDGLKELLNE